MGRFFTLNFHGAKKYNKVITRLITPDSVKKGKFVLKPWIKQLLLGNEFGSSPCPHPHCHGVIVTHEKMNFEEFQKKWKEVTKIRFAVLARAKSFNKDMRYCTKEDYCPIVCNVDLDLTPVMCRAYITSKKYPTLTHRTYPYCNLVSWFKTSFKQHFDEFHHMEEADELWLRSEKVANLATEVHN